MNNIQKAIGAAVGGFATGTAGIAAAFAVIANSFPGSITWSWWQYLLAGLAIYIVAAGIPFVTTFLAPANEPAPAKSTTTTTTETIVPVATAAASPPPVA